MIRFHRKSRDSWSDSKLLSWMLPEQSKKPFTFEDLRAGLYGKTPLAEEIIDSIQNIVMLPSDLIYSFNIYFKNVKGRTHIIDCGLESGVWYDLCYRMFEGPFNELVKFIEKEKDLETLDWETSLVYDEGYGVGKDNPKYGQLTSQAIAAIEQKALYTWYKFEYLPEKDDMEEDVKTEMLIRLMKIRTSLWTV